METTPNPEYSQRQEEFVEAAHILHEALGKPHSMYVLIVDSDNDEIHSATIGDCHCAELKAYQATMSLIIEKLPEELREFIQNAIQEGGIPLVRTNILKPSDN